MTAQVASSSLVNCYPEQNPFEMDPPPYNLTPRSMKYFTDLDTPEFIAAALAIARKSGMNPLYMMYGTNPLFLADRRLLYAKLPPIPYEKPPPLEQITLPDDVEFFEEINKNGNNFVIPVRIGNDVRLLKIVRL